MDINRLEKIIEKRKNIDAQKRGFNRKIINNYYLA